MRKLVGSERNSNLIFRICRMKWPLELFLKQIGFEFAWERDVSLTIGTSSGSPLYKRYGAYLPARRSIHSERLNVTSAIIEEERAKERRGKETTKVRRTTRPFRHYPRH